LIIDIEHIGERSMTRKSNPLAMALAAAFTIAAIWPLTLHASAQAATQVVFIAPLA
jgi:hypothetical protein